eukprot:CAMPEP_0115082438 /NCGR_PEP_ID=MMETSP0227-20121206/19904_1 /TAXON_ID=89957 /ORGANISM="Polarella glacialis, Strain CCMP 1383" /LENGTH=208 /DNA_ID=CAMNT_0002470533 /DNA_START=58 /DNA_END=685 /DNA_ORIENTATION=-
MLFFICFSIATCSLAMPHRQKLQEARGELEEALQLDDACLDSSDGSNKGCGMSLQQLRTSEIKAVATGTDPSLGAQSPSLLQTQARAHVASEVGAQTRAHVASEVGRPEGEPAVLLSNGYDAEAQQQLKGIMSECWTADFNDWTSCMAKKCQLTWTGTYHVIAGLPSGWGASIRDQDNAYLKWGPLIPGFGQVSRFCEGEGQDMQLHS